MSQEDSVVDASKPSPGRMYDYFLGGSHNFDVDRQAAEQVLALLPFVSKFSRLQRWTLQDLAVELTEKRGFDVIIDYASGLPTNDHIHNNAPKGTIVIYSDFDPIVVEYAHEILGNTPDVYYFQADARRPEDLLNHPKVKEILGTRRKAAFIYWGVSTFLDDKDVAHAARVLYDWASSDSCWAFNAQASEINPNDPAMMRVQKIYEGMGTLLFTRTREEYLELLKPWKLDENGFIPLLEWHGFEDTDLGMEDAQTFGPMGGGYGSYLIKG